jgi:hypothetical protein
MRLPRLARLVGKIMDQARQPSTRWLMPFAPQTRPDLEEAALRNGVLPASTGGKLSARKYLKRLSKLQDVLGADHDVTMTRPLLHDIGQSTVAPNFHQAVGAIIGWRSRHRIEAARALQERWRSFEKATPFWSS